MSNKTNYPWQRYANNVLIVKDDVGKKKPNTYALPDGAFGKQHISQVSESVKDVLTHFQHFPSEDIRGQRDFRKLNKMSVTQNIFTAKEFNQFIQTHDARVKIEKGKVRDKVVVKQQIFGRKNKTPSPIKDVIGNRYGDLAEQKQEQAYTSRPSTAKSRISVETKSSRLLRESIKSKSQLPPETLKKLSQFSNISGKVKSRF